jgi:hypothetical protein
LQVPRNFFSNFSTIFSIVLSKTPKKGIWRKLFFSYKPEVPFLGMDKNVPLVLTGICVANFLNITKFDLIFLHNTHILSVCLFIGLIVILFCLLSVFLSVCTICVNIGLSVHLSVFQPVPILLHHRGR